jgi:multiple sugar transport system permease protein
MIFGLLLSLLLEKKIAGLRLFRTVFVLPIMIAPVVVGVVWRYLYDPSFGFINFFLKLLGLSPQAWLSEKSLALVAIIVTQIWQWTPFVFLLLLAGLQGIDRELLEAAEIDGAGYWQNLFFIKLPLIKSIIAVAAVMRLIDAFRGLVVVYTMTFGGPGMATQTLALHLYKTAFISQRLGLASTVAVVLLLIIMILTLFLLKLMRSEE